MDINLDKPSPYKLITLIQLDKLIDLDIPLMYDSETVGFYGEIRLAQFYQKGWKCAYLVERPDPMVLVGILSKANMVAHNAHYDITCVQDNLGKIMWIPERFECTFLLARLHFYEKDGFSLDKVITYVLGYNPYKNKKDMQSSDWNAPALSDEQLQYGADDVIYMQLVYDIVKEKLDDISYQLDKLTTRYCLEFQTNGMPLSIDLLEAKFKDNLDTMSHLDLPINCNSPKQVREYIGSNQSDAKGLIRGMLTGNKRSEQVFRTRKLSKQNSFMKKFKDTLLNGSIFGKFMCTPRSGRTASKDQNLQQLPRALKGLFGVEEGGDTVILYSDFSQAQLRIVCAVTADTAMEKIFRDNGDLHSYVAEMIFGVDFDKRSRQIAKTANFGLLFGAGINTFLDILLKDAEMILPEDEARKIKRKWLKLWKQVALWQKQGIKDWKNGVVWETPLGRRYIAKMMTDQLAMQIQGAEAEVAKLAMHYMMPKLKELDTRILKRNFVHDSYIYTCPNEPELYKKACKIIAESMQEAWREISQNFKIEDLPMPCSVAVGWNWGDIENDDIKDVYNYSI